MLNQKELISLKKGDVVKHFLLIKKCDIRTAKSNKQYLSLELSDRPLPFQAMFGKILTLFLKK